MKTANRLLVLLMLAAPFAGCSKDDDKVAVTGVTVDPVALTLETGQTGQTAATVQPDNASDKTVTWTSGNPQVATVDATGKVTAVAVGDATITAKSGDVSANCAVTVASGDYATVIEGNYNGTLSGSPIVEGLAATVNIARTNLNAITLSTTITLPTLSLTIPVSCNSPVGKNADGKYTIEGTTEAMMQPVTISGTFDDAGNTDINIVVGTFMNITFTGTKAAAQ